jgi:hypothetical protein
MELTLSRHDLKVLLAIAVAIGFVILLAATGVMSTRTGYSCGCSIGSRLSSSAA